MMAVSRPTFLSDLTTLPRNGTPLTPGNTPKDPPLCDDDELRFRVLSEVETHVQDQLGNMQKPSTQENKRSLLQNIYTYTVGYFKKSQQVQDRWEIPFEDIQELAFVGSGGQGTVFSGIYRDQKVAVKKVNEPKQTDIWQLRKLDHQNIIKFLGVCTKPPCYCVVMEYCCRGNLHAHIRQMELNIPPNQVIQWSNDIASGMSYLHSKRIIHRDLKSLNVLIGEDNSLKISDFGTCRSLGTHTTRITVIGSCSWMAPELIRNEPCNEKVDVWSFGVLLWELLTRQEPYKDLNQGSILYGVGSNKLHLPIPDTCPDDLKQLLNNCWQQKSKCRPSFRQILDQLNLISTGAFSHYTPAQYRETQDTWQQEVSAHFNSMKIELDHLSMLSNENSIISKREEELRHAQEVRIMYEKKLAVAAELCQQLAICKEILAEREHDLDRRKKQLNEKYKQFLEDDDSSDSDDSPRITKSHSSRRKKRSSLKLKQKQDETDAVFLPSKIKTTPPNITIPTEEPILRSNSLLTQQGEYSPAVKEFLNSFNDLRLGHSPQVPSPRTSYRRHRRVASYGGFTSKPMASRHSSRSVTESRSKESLNISRKFLDAPTNHQNREKMKTPSHLQFNEPNSDGENIFDLSPCKSPNDDSGREGDDDQSEVEEQLTDIIPSIEHYIPTSPDPLSIIPTTLESSTTPTKGSISTSTEESEPTSLMGALVPYDGKWNVLGYLRHFLQT